MTVLDDIIEGVREKLAEREARVSLDQIKAKALEMPEAKDVISALRDGGGAVSIIAEIKRSSPSKGALGEIPDPAALAQVVGDAAAL